MYSSYGQFLGCFLIAFFIDKGILLRIGKWRFKNRMVDQLERSVAKLVHHDINHLPMCSELEDIVAQIFTQLILGLDKQKEKIINHAIKHKALLVSADIDLNVSLSNRKLYEALKIVKYKFEQTHENRDGAIKNQHGSEILINVLTASGRPFVGGFEWSDSAISIADRADYLPDEDKIERCKIVIDMSILTPYTKKNYYFLNAMGK